MLKNKNIKTFLRLEPPSYFLSSLPITAEIENMILRTRKEIEEDSPCIGTSTLNEDNVSIGCWRHISEIKETVI